MLVSTLLSVLDVIHRPPQASAIGVRDVLADFQAGRSSLLAKGLGRPTVDHGTGRPDFEGPRRGAPAAKNSAKRDDAAAPKKSKVHKQKGRAIAPKAPIAGEARAQAESTKKSEPTPKSEAEPELKTEANTRGQREAEAMSTPDVEAEEKTPARSEAED